MAIIYKKTWPEEFELVALGKKKFDFRVADFSLAEGDTLVLQEWDPDTNSLTGRQIEKVVRYIRKFDLDTYGQRELIEKNGMYVIQFE